jgi:hypothetical protein
MKTIVCALLIVIGASQSHSAEIQQWSVSQGGNGHYYRLVVATGAVTWDEARIAATNAGGYLATITSSEENAYVSNLIRGFNSSDWAYTFIGAQKPTNSGSPSSGWTWVTGEPFTYTAWDSGEPNNAGGTGEDKLIIWANAWHGGRWNDIVANPEARFPGSYLVESEAPTGQTVVLAFGQDAPFRLRGAFNFYFEATGTTTAATLTPQYKTEIMAAVRKIFSASGITNINVTDVPTTGATTVYFSSDNLNISGKALGGIDRFNERAEDKVIVYTFGDAVYDAETVVHEVGHSLGLLHVNPGTRTTSEGLIKEVMFAPEVPGALPRFINAVSDHDSFNVADTLYTHNPLYHLKRYLDGYTSNQLEALGILPGTWDLPFTDLISMHLDFGDTQRTLYNVVLLRSADGTNSVSPIAQFDAITLAELEQKRFHLVPGTCLSLVGSSTPGGESDLVLSTGDPSIEASRFVPADAGLMAVTLQQIIDTAFQVISEATTTGELVPLLPTIMNLSRMSTPGEYSMTFAGDIGANFIIETSPDCNNWSECEAVRAEAPTTTVLLTSPISDSKRFWRIKRGQP